jgi:NTP pyrophosphatase (non-canonical NTP hydrolase)
MTLDEYQTAAARTMNPRLTASERLLDAAAGTAEEGAEVLAHVRKHLFQGRSLDKEKLAEELGDVLWCVAATATASGLKLEDIAARNTQKLARRWPDGMPAS